MQLFYHPKIDNSAVQFVFDKEESRHLIKVLRKKEGDVVRITNGNGTIYSAKIMDANAKMCKVEIVQKERIHRKMHHLHLAVSPTKSNDRYEWFIEKATEIGIQEITPIFSEHSERTVVKIERLEKIMQSAMKQSLRAYLPKLNEPITLKEFLNKEHSGLNFIAHCEKGDKLDLKRCIAADKDITILIGPEGDFSSKEIKLAEKNGFLPISLGEARLRTETAALVSCMAVALVNSGS